MAKALLQFSIELPAAYELAADEGKVLRAMGREQAKQTKRRLKRGQGADGSLPESHDPKANKPLNRTGTLIKSIRQGKPKLREDEKSIEVFPHGKRDDTKGLNNFGLLAALEKSTAVGEVDVLGPTDKDQEAMGRAAEKELAKQAQRKPLLVQKGGTVRFGSGQR